MNAFSQCFGSGLDPDSIRSVDPDPDTGIGGQKDPQEQQKLGISCFEALDVLF